MLVPTLKVKQPYLLEEILKMTLEKDVHKMNIFLSKAYHFNIFHYKCNICSFKKISYKELYNTNSSTFPHPLFSSGNHC